jgi:serine/threonine-protein kinase
LLSDRYRLGNEIGRGGMSTVYKATDELLGRNVAVKLLELDGATLPDAKERFRREAQIAASLNHPNIVTIYDTGIDRTTAFLVMELLTGPTLAERVGRADKLALEEILNVGEQVCQALGAAHASGVVHRDIKPSNVAYAEHGTVKVLDFGVARMIEATTGQMALTQAATVIGTASYLSPEQARGDSVSLQTDLYAFGCLLFALVSGGPPFRGENALVVCSQHLHKDPPHLSDLWPGVPVALSALVDELLQKDASRRPANADVVRSRLASIVVSASQDDLTMPLVISEEVTRSRPGSVVVNAPQTDLTIPLVISEEVTSTRQRPVDTTWPGPTPEVPRPRATPASRLADTSAVSKASTRASLRTRWGVGLAVAVILAIAIAVVATIANNNPPSAPPTAPSITIPAPSPGSAPLPSTLVRSLNNLARSVDS